MKHKSGLDLRTKDIDDSITIIEEDPRTIAVEYQPGNGTRYTLTITTLSRFDSDEFLKCIGREGPTWLLVWLNGSTGKAMTFGRGLLHYNYVRDKLECSISDAIVIAEIVGRLTKNEHVSCDEILGS